MSGKPKSPATPSSSAWSFTLRYSPRGTPAAAKCSFCANLSWMIPRVRLVGWTSTPRASSSSSAATSMCSISTVTTSQSFANERTSSRFWNEPVVEMAAMDAGELGFGSSEWSRTPIGAAAIASMRPSWPPPKIPIFAVRESPSGHIAYPSSSELAPAAKTPRGATPTRRDEARRGAIAKGEARAEPRPERAGEERAGRTRGAPGARSVAHAGGMFGYFRRPTTGPGSAREASGVRWIRTRSDPRGCRGRGRARTRSERPARNSAARVDAAIENPRSSAIRSRKSAGTDRTTWKSAPRFTRRSRVGSTWSETPWLTWSALPSAPGRGESRSARGGGRGGLLVVCSHAEARGRGRSFARTPEDASLGRALHAPSREGSARHLSRGDLGRLPPRPRAHAPVRR